MEQVVHIIDNETVVSLYGHLVASSQYFALDPLPSGLWKLTTDSRLGQRLADLTHQHPVLPLHQMEWVGAGDRLEASAYLYGILHHFTAIAVIDAPDGSQAPRDLADEPEFEHLAALAYGRMSTVRIMGWPHEYVVFMLPGNA
jgi:hypothetical protein